MTNMFGYVIVLLLIIICYVFVNYFYFNHSKNAKYFYEKISGHINNQAAQNVINETNKIENPTALEKFRSGEVLLNNLGNIPESQNEYIDVLNIIVNNPLDNPNLFILDRIEADYTNNIELINLNNQNFTHENVLEHIPYVRNHVTGSRVAFGEEPRNRKEKKRDIVLDKLKQKQQWTLDTQSVHDSNVSQSMRDSFHSIKNYNIKEFGALTHKIVNGIINNIRTVFDDFDKTEHFTGGYNKVLNMASDGLKVHDVGTEQEVVVEIWRRINSIDNEKNKTNLQHSLYEAMDDCVENGSLVCTQGRVTKMLQSMAHMDVDDKIGSMNTTEAIRNEIYKNASEILNNNIKSLSENDQSQYNVNKSNENITIMENTSREQITSMVNDTEGLGENQKTNLINECVAVV